MDADDKRNRAASYGGVAKAYADYRPEYPVEAARWLVGSGTARVLELGCGTGKLTKPMVDLGHDVVATDTSPEMLRLLTKAIPAAHTAIARAESIPMPSSSVDVVVAAHAFHWFDHDRALPEIARVLRPGGVLALAWNVGDHKVPWVKKVFRLIDVTDEGAGDDPVEDSELFATSEQKVFRHWQEFHRDSLTGFVASSSKIATLTPAEGDEVLAKVGEIYDSYGRGPDGMLMPWKTHAYRARVSGLADERREKVPDIDDGLLIDFS